MHLKQNSILSELTPLLKVNALFTRVFKAETFAIDTTPALSWERFATICQAPDPCLRSFKLFNHFEHFMVLIYNFPNLLASKLSTPQ